MGHEDDDKEEEGKYEIDEYWSGVGWKCFKFNQKNSEFLNFK